MRDRDQPTPGSGRAAATTPYLTAGPAADGRPVLFCFPHAGGSASVFTALRTALAPVADVLPVQLPGRENRLRDRRPGSMAELVAVLDQQLDPYLAGPHVFYGHSMGALVAHDLVARRQERGVRIPDRLVAGAARGPRLPAAFVAAHVDSDEKLLERIVDCGGMSPDLLRYPDWYRPALELTRADLGLCATRSTSPTAPLDCPVDVFHGVADPLVTERDALAWVGAGSVGGALHRFDGGHFFFLRESAGPFASRLGAVVRATAEPAGPDRKTVPPRQR
ncbi:thioesterase II family protein [Kitasatospora sp. NPDC127116]|uniref:thioesterase II family protein n=1 Tax=Kitasatospora sp. NPDC127116 TaxID=3345367 RepID=UPI0033860BA3